MSAQSFLAKAGLRTAILGSAAALAIAAPLSAGNYSTDAHTDASRIGMYFDRTAGAEKMSSVVMGVEQFSVSADKVTIRQGSTPGTPGNGDVWMETTGLFYRANGATVGPLTAGGGGTIGGSIAADQVAVGSGVDTIAGSSSLVWTVANGLSSNRVAASQNEMFGHQAGNTTLTGTDNTCVGFQAGLGLTTGSRNVVVGSTADPFGGAVEDAVLVGYDTSIGIGGIAIGSGAASVFGNIVIGFGADGGSNANCIAIGAGATTTGGTGSIAIGDGAVTTAANQLVIGGATAAISEVVLGNGVTSSGASSAMIRATGGDTGDAAGGHLFLAAGIGYGSGGADVHLQVALPGSGGGSGNVNVLSTSLYCYSDGTVRCPRDLPASAPNNGTLIIGTTGGQQVGIGGGNIFADANIDLLGDLTAGTITMGSGPTLITLDGGSGQLFVESNIACAGPLAAGTVTAGSGGFSTGDSYLMKSSVALADGAGGQVASLNNSPGLGDPTKWLVVDDNGTTRYVPSWEATA